MKQRIILYIVIALLAYAGIIYYEHDQKNKLGLQGSAYSNSSYMLGYTVGHAYRINHFNMNNDDFILGVRDGLLGNNTLASQPVMQEIWQHSLKKHQST